MATRTFIGLAILTVTTLVMVEVLPPEKKITKEQAEQIDKDMKLRNSYNK